MIPINSRVAQRDTILPVGGGLDGKKPVFVPEGSVVAYHAYAVQRRPDLWGKDAAEFNPERWMNKEKSSFESVCIDPFFTFLPKTHALLCVTQSWIKFSITSSLTNVEELPSLQSRAATLYRR